jgi:hypothetical protein
MGKTIVFFNLADKHEHGLAHSSAMALRNKYPRYSAVWEFMAGANQVHLVDLFDLLEQERRPLPIRSLGSLTALMPQLLQRIRERVAIAELCGRADKIMIGVHGHFGDTNQGYAGMGWGMGSGVVGTASEFARLVAGFLCAGKTYKLSLIMCFGARSARPRVNHDGNLDEADIKSSFAYKFFKEICQRSEATVTMTARTGSVAFDASTGRTMVQTEAAVQAEMDNADLQAAEYTKRIARTYEQLQRFMCNTQEGLRKFRAMEDRMEADHAVPRNSAERTIKNYVDLRTQVTQLQQQSSDLAGKYGKFVYQYNRTDGVVTVMRKYNQGVATFGILYQGQL